MCLTNKILVPVVLILLAQMSGSQKNLVPRIRIGYQCSTKIAPYFVILEMEGKDESGKEKRSGCAGSLIMYSWILTAAHCLGFKKGKVFSAYDMPPQLKQVRNIKEVHIHPNYNVKEFHAHHDLRFDIALILVDEPFHEDAATRVATLPGPGFTKKCNQVLAAGVGRTYTNESANNVFPLDQRPLKCANLGLIDIDVCRKNYSRVDQFDTKLIICTYGPQGKEGPCEGDSGGPLMCDKVVIGIGSTSGECSVRTRPSTYTKVESYLDFIDQFTKPSGISIKHARTNDNNVGGQKPASTNNTRVHTNGTSVADKKAPDKSPANIIGRLPNWKLVLFAVLHLIVLYR